MNTTLNATDRDPDYGIDALAAATSASDIKIFSQRAALEADSEAPDPREAALTAMLLTPVDPVTEAFQHIDYLIDSGCLYAPAREHYAAVYSDYLANRMSYEQVAATGIFDLEFLKKHFGVPEDVQREAYRKRVRDAIEFTNKLEAHNMTSSTLAAEMRATCQDFLDGKTEHSINLVMIVDASGDAAWEFFTRNQGGQE